MTQSEIRVKVQFFSSTNNHSMGAPTSVEQQAVWVIEGLALCGAAAPSRKLRWPGSGVEVMHSKRQWNLVTVGA
jgi:hypothetical protein